MIRWFDDRAPSSTCCHRACSGCTPPCSAGWAHTCWGWGCSLVWWTKPDGNKDLTLPKKIGPPQMSWDTAWWLCKDRGGQRVWLWEAFIEILAGWAREGTLRGRSRVLASHSLSVADTHDDDGIGDDDEKGTFGIEEEKNCFKCGHRSDMHNETNKWCQCHRIQAVCYQKSGINHRQVWRSGEMVQWHFILTGKWNTLLSVDMICSSLFPWWWWLKWWLLQSQIPSMKSILKTSL